MSVVSRQALPARPESLALVEMVAGTAGEGTSMMLFCGLGKSFQMYTDFSEILP